MRTTQRLFLFLIWTLGVLLGFVVAQLVSEDETSTLSEETFNQIQEQWMDEAEANARACQDRCTEAGFPSLNAFFVSNRSLCVCQETGARDDLHGFFILRVEP